MQLLFLEKNGEVEEEQSYWKNKHNNSLLKIVFLRCIRRYASEHFKQVVVYLDPELKRESLDQELLLYFTEW